MSEVVYILCQYDNGRSGRSLNSPPAGVSYVDYLVNAIKSTGRRVVIVSIAAGKDKSYFFSKNVVVDENERIIYLPTLKQRGNFGLRIAQFFSYLHLLYFIAVKIGKKDKILLCHDRGISVFYKIVRGFIRRQYYYFIGEIFSAIYDKGECSIQSEIRSIQGVKGYILINNLMPKLLGNISNYCVCHGRYQLPKNAVHEFNDGLIHVVYAGKIDQKDVTDAFLAVQVAKFLDNRYRVHVLGYGIPKDIEALEQTIATINMKLQRNVVSYDGCLFGEEYEKFLLSCDVGLCTRVMEDYKASLCFPSKTIVYLAHGLNVVAPDMEVLKTSNISQYISYINGIQTPKKVAEAIMKIKFTDKIIKMQGIDELNNRFVRSLDSMLSYEE